MTQHDTTLAAQTRGGRDTEASFEPHEMFYSRTDPRGVIARGNQVFQRISGFDWEELIGAPHKVVRHPDMPRGVFHLFWARLKAGKRMVAYVKNRVKGGGHYWVLALSWPIEDGYLSVRIKPTSPLKAEVEALYRTLLNAEREEGLSPDESAERLLALLRDQGYPDYDSFMSTALARELRLLSSLTGTPLTAAQDRFDTMHETIDALGGEMDALFDVVHGIRTVPMNMRILASRLENAGGPISAISVNYSQMLEEMSAWIKTFHNGPDCTYARIRGTILMGKLLTAASIVQNRMAEAFATDMAGTADAIDLKEEQERLHHEARMIDLQTQDALKSVETEVRRLSRSVLDMKRYVTGLSSSRMMCKIESASLGQSGSALTGIVEQLDERQDEIENHLARVVELNTAVQGHIAILRRPK